MLEMLRSAPLIMLVPPSDDDVGIKVSITTCQYAARELAIVKRFSFLPTPLIMLVLRLTVLARRRVAESCWC